MPRELDVDELLTGGNGLTFAFGLLVLGAWLDTKLAPRRWRRCRKEPIDARAAFGSCRARYEDEERGSKPFRIYGARFSGLLIRPTNGTKRPTRLAYAPYSSGCVASR